MARGTGKKILFGLLAFVIVAGGAIGIYIWHFSSKHKTEYGKKGEVSPEAAKQIALIRTRLEECRKEVFLHPKLPYRPKAVDREGDFQKAIDAMTKKLEACIIGEVSADGKGYSGQMEAKNLALLLEHKECKSFADDFATFDKCQVFHEPLIENAGFEEAEAPGDGGQDKKEGEDKGAAEEKKEGADMEAGEKKEGGEDKGAGEEKKEGVDMGAGEEKKGGEDMGAVEEKKAD